MARVSFMNFMLVLLVLLAVAAAQTPCKVPSGACGPNSSCEPTDVAGQEACVCITGYSQTETGCQYLPTVLADNGELHLSGTDVVFDFPDPAASPSISITALLSDVLRNTADIATAASSIAQQESHALTVDEIITGATSSIGNLQTQLNAATTLTSQISSANKVAIASMSGAVASAAAAASLTAVSTLTAAVSSALSTKTAFDTTQTATLAASINRLQTVDIPSIAATNNAAIAALKSTEVAQADSTAQKALLVGTGTSTVVAAVQAAVSSTQSTLTSTQATVATLGSTAVPAAQSAAIASAKVYTDAQMTLTPSQSTVTVAQSTATRALTCGSTNGQYNPVTGFCGNPAPDYESAWTQFPQQAGANSYFSFNHGLNAYPDRVLVVTTAMAPADPANGYMFTASGCAFCDDECDNYGGIVYAYNNQSVRVWAPSRYNASPYGSSIFLQDGWGPLYNTDSSSYPNDIWGKVYAWRNFTGKTAEYDSGFFTMISQGDSASFRELVHGFGNYPHRVQVVTKIDSGPNAGFYFEGVGAASGDDESNEYGGLVFAYDTSRVRLWAPDNSNNNNPNGYIMFVGDGWGGEVNAIYEKTALVRVRAWKEDSRVPPPDVQTPWVSLSSQAGAGSFKQLPHLFGTYPSRVVVQALAIDGPNTGFIFESIGSGTDDDEADDYGGLVSAYDDNYVRLWAPSANNRGSWGRIIFITDGWGGEVNTQSSQTAMVRIRAWR